MGCHVLLQRIFPTQGSNLCLLHLPHCRWIFFLWLRHGGKLQLLKSGTKLRAFYALLEFILTATLSGTNTENREFKMVVHITQLMRSGASTETPVGLTRHLDPTPWKDSAARTNRGTFCLAQLICGNGSHSAIGSHHSQESQV